MRCFSRESYSWRNADAVRVTVDTAAGRVVIQLIVHLNDDEGERKAFSSLTRRITSEVISLSGDDSSCWAG